MGIKHNVVALIYGFVQKENKSVRDCANRLRQYISRCPEGEMPSSPRLVSIFLEGLLNKSLHANLYAKKHNTLNACIKDAIDFDDNCEIFGNVNASARSETSSTKNTIETGKNHPIDAEAIAEMVMKKMNQVFRPPQRPAEQPRFVRKYICGQCGGDHPTLQCLPKQNNPNPAAPRTDKWCDFEQKWTNHETQECYHRIRYLRQQGIAQQPAGPPVQPQNQRMGNQFFAAPGGEHAQPVLGNQPPLPRAAPVRFMQPEEITYDGTMVPVTSYYKEEVESNLESLNSLCLQQRSHHLCQRVNTKWIIIPYGSLQMEE